MGGKMRKGSDSRKPLQGLCTGLDPQGRGLVQAGGREYALPGILPGEEALFTERGKVLELRKPSPLRQDPLCPVYEACGGCQLRHLSYSGQLAFKEGMVRDLLKRFGEVSPILGMEDPRGYRNKAIYTFARGRDGKVVYGRYGEGSHEVISGARCLIQDEEADALAATLRSLLGKFRISVYEEDRGRGFLRHLLVRKAVATGEMMAVLVGTSLQLPGGGELARALAARHPALKTVVLNENSRKTSAVLGWKEKVLFGPGFIEDRLLGLSFRLSPRSFYQVNPVQTAVLYSKALELAVLTGKERVLDAYCGIGTIGLLAAGKAREVLGVESNGDAVRDAQGNARRNGVDNIRFLEGDAGAYMRQAAARGEGFDVVLMDPPRAGSDEAFLSSLLKLAPPKVVYVSCNPLTLERDLNYLWKGGYRVEAIVPVDMFPETVHVECVVLITRVEE